MDENLHKDNLEDFFKKSFDQLSQEVPDGEWDTPSNQVWEGVESGLLTAGGKTGLKISWTQMSAAAAVLMLIGVFYLLSENQQLSNRLDEQTQTLELLQNEVDKQQNTISINSPTELTDTEISKTKDEEESNENRILNSNQLNQSSDYASLVAGKTKKEVGNTSGAKNRKNEIVLEKNVDQITAESQKGKTINETIGEGKENEIAAIDLTPSPMIEQQWPSYIQAESLIEQPLSDYHNFTKPFRKQKKGFYVGGYISPNQTYRQFERNLPGPFPEPDIDQFTSSQLSLEAGIRVGVKLGPKWSLETGLSKYDIRHKGKFMFKFMFDPSIELPRPDGVRESTYETCFLTAYGKSDLEVKINRSNMHPLQPGQAINVEVESVQKFQFTSIPLIANYQLKQGKVSIGLKGGIALNLLNSQELDLRLKAKMNGLGAKIKKQEDDYSIMKDKTVDYIVGLDFSYLLSPRISLEIEPTYRKNIKPIIDTEMFSTNAYAFGVNAGVNYHF